MAGKDSERVRFHHVGIVVNTDTIKSLIKDFIGIGERTWHVETQGVDVTFLPLGNAYIEMVYPHGNKTIEKYLETHGEGIHHFCFEVADLDYWARRCEERGFKVVSRDHRCFFIHPKTFGGILVEFIMMSRDDPMRELTLLDR
ncbi:MAG: VOC family protein [Candidatus Bathyarchaeia archaeon]